MWGERQDSYQAPSFRCAPELSPEARRALQFLRAWVQDPSGCFTLGILEPLFSGSAPGALEKVAAELCHFNYIDRVGCSRYELCSVDVRRSCAGQA